MLDQPLPRGPRRPVFVGAAAAQDHETNPQDDASTKASTGSAIQASKAGTNGVPDSFLAKGKSAESWSIGKACILFLVSAS
ncbi:hypothetical protein FVE85_8603 [Porphyridium purpureum]|uniref:Uncharacterized protein n=1 Tax=Porphyridium purpureum TaxID=35688 RepID=A0A5J4YPC5_PORPP|nr:hypothetical protein FVE85_8603 [Porphyridium purpureum]|eukprot:POR7339..scf296_7